MRDFSDALIETRKRIDDAATYLKVEELRARQPLLETEASQPDLWDDPDQAKRVTGDLSIIDGGQAQWGVIWPGGMPDYFNESGAA